MTSNITAAVIILFVLHCVACESAWAKFAIYSQTSLDVELVSFNEFADSSIFKGSLFAGKSRQIDTTYHGLAILLFTGLRIWYPIDHLGSASLVLPLGLLQMPLLQEIKRINRIAQKKNLLGSTRYSHFCVSPQDEKTRERSRKAFVDVVLCIRLTK